MKVHIPKEPNKLIRISFGYIESVSLEETTVNDVYNKAIDIFSKQKVKLTFEVDNHNPIKKPETSIGMVMQIREEDKGIKGGSKSKTLYGLTPKEAKDIFLKELSK
jgi:hypothetical protein